MIAHGMRTLSTLMFRAHFEAAVRIVQHSTARPKKKGASLHARALSRSTVARRLLLVAAEDAFQDAAQAICAMMNTPDGKRLMALLGADGGKTLREAANAVQQGDEKRAQDTMAPLLSNPEVQKILSAMNRNLNHG